MSRLYAIKQAYLEVLELVETEEVAFADAKDTLDMLEDEFADKADNLACYIKSLNAEIGAIKDEEAALANRRRAKERTAEGVKEYLSRCMTEIGLDRLETPRNKLSFRKSDPIAFEDADAFATAHPEFCETTVKLQRAEVKKAIKGGAVLDGAWLEEKRNLQIK